MYYIKGGVKLKPPYCTNSLSASQNYYHFVCNRMTYFHTEPTKFSVQPRSHFLSGPSRVLWRRNDTLYTHHWISVLHDSQLPEKTTSPEQRNNSQYRICASFGLTHTEASYYNYTHVTSHLPHLPHLPHFNSYYTYTLPYTLKVFLHRHESTISVSLFTLKQHDQSTINCIKLTKLENCLN